MSYKNYIKIERAKELLKTGDMKIGDIANKCGYENSSYFSETFKKTEKIRKFVIEYQERKVGFDE